MHTFQKLLTTLTEFWANEGCIVHQGHDVEVGAGTFNPATFFRCLGPEPYSTVYIEPSRRPQDGRYGENPNRLQLFHQLQVLIKPSPLDIKEKYMKSLEVIGIDLAKHDIRFVHDDWESPTLGAWGLGWEVWIDGMEITQFTYFQGMASMPLSPISVELTYGLERLSMILQKKKSFFDMQWNETYSYADVVKQGEVEWSTYNFDTSTPELWFEHFNSYEKEAVLACSKELPFPAYDFVMKASHSFNMLEARGVLSTTERTGYIARVRDLARAAAECYVATREKAGFPLKGHVEPTKLAAVTAPQDKIGSAKETATYVLEIGSEELPALYVPSAVKDLKRLLEALLSENNIPYKKVRTTGTPRRLVAFIDEMAFATPDVDEEKRGPPASIAFDDFGTPTKQGIGFFASIGVEPKNKNTLSDGVALREIKGNEYLFANVHKKGASTHAVLAETLPKCIESIAFPKKMKWADLPTQYARPLQWIVSLHGTHIVPLAVGNLIASNASQGHFQRDPVAITISSADEYTDLLRNADVVVHIDERKQMIETQLNAIREAKQLKPIQTEAVMKHVLYLSEYPQLMASSFDERFLEVPQEVLISEMVEHQKYFPLACEDGSLSPCYVITADNVPSREIEEGNGNVLSARLSDGVFLYEQDIKLPLDVYAQKLERVVFQKQLGTVADKVKRIERIALALQEALSLSNRASIERAARLCKADLTSELVQEFPALQGTIGRRYAEVHNEPNDVAAAIEEHYLPKSEKGALPATEAGVILSIADKIDNLCAYFSVGLTPTSSSDPYALRRQTLGILRILIENKLSLDLPSILDVAFANLPSKPAAEVLSFITQRAKTVFLELGLKKDEIEATLSECRNPYDQFCRVQALHTFRETETFQSLYEVYKRARGQLGGQDTQRFAASTMKEDAEHALFDAIQSIDDQYSSALQGGDYSLAFTKLASLQSPLATLFDQVKILDDDLDVRNNRIALLQNVFSRFDQLLDFSKIQE